MRLNDFRSKSAEARLIHMQRKQKCLRPLDPTGSCRIPADLRLSDAASAGRNLPSTRAEGQDDGS